MSQWKIVGSGDLILLAEQGHRQRRMALALRHQLDHGAVLPWKREDVLGRIESHMIAYARIMRAVGVFEERPAVPLVICTTTWAIDEAA